MMTAARKGHSLVELIIIVLILGALTFVAVPRLQYAAIYRKQAHTTAKKIATALRRTRMLAISNAAGNSDGYALNITSSSYEIVDLSDSSQVDSYQINSKVSCSGGTSFQFGPLGNLKTGSDTQLTVSAQGRSFTIEITPATGMVKCTQN